MNKEEQEAMVNVAIAEALLSTALADLKNHPMYQAAWGAWHATKLLDAGIFKAPVTIEDEQIRAAQYNDVARYCEDRVRFLVHGDEATERARHAQDAVMDAVDSFQEWLKTGGANENHE